MDAAGGLLYQVGQSPEFVPGSIEIRDLATLKVRKSLAASSDFMSAAGSHAPVTLAAVDSVRHRLFYPYSVNEQPNHTLAVVDGEAGKVTESFRLCSPHVSGACAPTTGLGVEGLWYWPPDDLLYVLFATPGGANASGPGAPARLHVQAINASDGAVRWNYSVPGCTSLFTSLSTPAAFGRSGDSLYLSCVAGVAGALGSVGAGVVVKMTVPAASAPQSVLGFAAPRIPTRGLFDPATHRLFLFEEGAQIVAVFDGAHEVWVGDISSDQTRVQLGVSSERGRLYLCGAAVTSTIEPTGGLLVTDAGVETPATVGMTFPEIDCSPSSELSPIQADPSSNRVFVPLEAEQGLWGVLQDDLPRYRAPAAFDPDEGAEDVSEQAGVTGTNLTAEAGAFGTRLVWVGGPNNAVDNLSTAPALGAGIRDVFPIFTFQNRNRDVRFADVPFAKLGNDGMQATAISIGRDERLEADFSALREFGGEEREGLKDAIDTSTTPSWPFEPSLCFAFGGETDVPDDEKEGSSAKCDLEAASVIASAEAKKPVSKDLQEVLASLGGTISVGEATARVDLHRDPSLGLVTVAEAVSRNVVLAGRVFITEAGAKAIASAAGHPGKAVTTYERYFRGVKVLGSDGEPVFECADACVPRQVVDAINGAIGPRIRARLPEPGGYRLGTPKGSTASIEQGFWDRTEEQVLFDKPPNDLTVPGFELQVNADLFSHSGYILQLAGVTAYTRYAIYRLPELVPLLLPPIPPVVSAPPLIPGTDQTISQPRVITRTLVDRIRKGVRWVFSWQRDGLKLLATWALLLTPVYVAARRRFMLARTPRAG